MKPQRGGMSYHFLVRTFGKSYETGRLCPRRTFFPLSLLQADSEEHSTFVALDALLTPQEWYVCNRQD
ncbi:MAG: hypothetical protein ACK567_00390 [Chitinophagales bacterium]|nr:hypothetical protein [Sphingobacteriales bacterium]